VPQLVLGPLLRYAAEDEATIWVETDGPCEVAVTPRGLEPCAARTLSVAGHHYALVHVTGLPRATATPYEIRLDGALVWPEPGSAFPPSALRTHDRGGPVRIAFGSCRVSTPNEPPYTLRKDDDPRGREVDALRGLALRMALRPSDEWPHALLLLGDQVYADEVSPRVRERIAARRGLEAPPGDGVADFEEYTWLYHEAWSDPVIRWLLSTIPSAMIFDDHDVHDDWNTSAAWVREKRAEPWWRDRILGAYASYVLYQHWGNLAPHELAQSDLYRRMAEADDATELVFDFAARAEAEASGTRWSFAREIGPARLVMVDSRAGRVLGGTRRMVDAGEWDWIEAHARGDVEHLLIGTSLPLLLAPALHHLEAWNEATAGPGRLGRWAEKLRQGLDLEHWAAFHASFTAMVELLREVGAGARGRAPSTITVLSGDVHHAYLAEVGFPRAAGVRSGVWQGVCSPFRNPLDHRERRAILGAWTRPATTVARALARRAGVRDPAVRWRLAHRAPWFDNQVDGARRPASALPAGEGDARHGRSRRRPDGGRLRAPARSRRLLGELRHAGGGGVMMG
jgi:PhoD-like phosphatase